MVNVSSMNKMLIVLIICTAATLGTNISYIFIQLYKTNKTVKQTDNMKIHIPYYYTIFHETNKIVDQKDDYKERRLAPVCKPISTVLKKEVKPDPSIRETTCNCCFPHAFDYLINNRNICNTIGPNQDIDLFIMIFTKHTNLLLRQAIRQTWLTASKSNTANVRYVFLLGKVKNVELDKDIAQENDLYKDFLKEDFIDTYENQTLKTIMGFKWIANHCRAAKNVIKTDDDTFINVPNILKYIRKSGKKLKTTMVGSCRYEGPIRDPSSKWYVSRKDYKETRYPGFCSGTGYLTSFEMIEKIYEVSPYVPFFWLEDIYVSLCFRKVGGTVENVLGYYSIKPDFDPCLFKGDKLFISHDFTHELMRMVWKATC